MAETDKTNLVEAAIVDNLDDILESLRKHGVRRAAFGSIMLEFDAGRINPSEVIVKKDAQPDPRVPNRPGYATLFDKGAPSFVVTQPMPKE